MLLTTPEFNTGYSRALNKFATFAYGQLIDDWFAVRYKADPDRTKLNLAWLYSYALNTWDNTDGADNYLTDRQMTIIIERIHEL